MKFEKGLDPQNVKKEIEDGQLEYKEGQIAEFAGEKPDHDDYGWELSKPEVSEVESRANLEAGIEAAREIIEGVKGDFIGASLDVEYSNTYGRGEILTVEEVGVNAILEKLAYTKDWSPLYDDQIAYSGRCTGDGTDLVYYIGDKPTHSAKYFKLTDAETFYFVGDKPVNQKDYKTFREEIRKMLAENYRQRGGTEIWKRQLPKDIAEPVKQMKFDRRTEQVLEEGTPVSAGKINFKQGPYGDSYFGSGGGYGSVKAFVLSEWKNGKRVERNVTTEKGDDGFTTGAIAASIESDTIIIATGGDSVGEGRSWEEIYVCE